MNKLFEDKMSYFQWQNGMELRYNVMPAWWWNDYMKKKAYEKYLEEKGDGFDQRVELEMSYIDLQKVLWDSYDVAISMGMTEEDARVWALNNMMEDTEDE